MSIRDYRKLYRPYEYPEVEKYKNRIGDCYWRHTKIPFDSDVLEFSRLKDSYQGIMKRTMLAISQIEAAAVKDFWRTTPNLFPKPEINDVCVSFAEAEVRHSDTYGRLLVLLGFENEFFDFLETDVAKNRFSWLEKPRDKTNFDIACKVAIFSMVMENVSLFSQFLIMVSFRRFLGNMKNIFNGIAWTAQDELIHFEFGAWLVETMRKEYPEIDEQGFVEKIRDIASNALEHEVKMLDYILNGEEIEFLPRAVIIEFIKDRINTSLSYMNIKPVFEIDQELFSEVDWFFELINCTVQRDFFDCRPVEYSVDDVSFETESLF